MNINIIHRRDREKSKISLNSFKEQNIKAPPPSPTNIHDVSYNIFMQNEILNNNQSEQNNQWGQRKLKKSSKICKDMYIEDVL